MGLSPFQAGALESWRPGPAPSLIFESRLLLASPTRLHGLCVQFEKHLLWIIIRYDTYGAGYDGPFAFPGGIRNPSAVRPDQRFGKLQRVQEG